MRLTLLLSSALLLTACGGGSSDTSAPAASEPAPAADAAAEAPAADAEAPAADAEAPADGALVIEATDLMKYNVTELKAVAGKEISLTLKHVGSLDKSAMGHNVVILKPGTDTQAFAMAGMTAKETDYIGADVADQVVAKTKLLGGGESDTIAFTIAEPGTYPFVCTFPGHAAVMKGTLTVVAEG